MGSPLEVLANYNPTGFALANQQRQAQLAQTQAVTAGIPAQTQAVQLENQLRIQQLKDTAATTAAWKDVDQTADPNTQQQQLAGGIIKNGGSYNALITSQQHWAQMRAANATATKDELANKATRHEELAGYVNGIADAPQEQQQALWQQYAPQIKNDLDPGDSLPDTYPGNDAARALAKMHLTVSNQAKFDSQQAETAKNRAEADATRQKMAIQADLEARQKAARENPNDAALQAAALDAKERADLQMKQIDYSLRRDEFNDKIRHEMTDEHLRAVTNSIQAGRLEQTKLVNGIKYGPGTIDYWVQTLKDNPDAVKEIPVDIKGTVNQAFRVATGLPLPIPLQEALKQNETNAGTSIENINRIRQLVADPEIQSRLGPILGRLGNVEQRVGTAAGLSPQAEQKAQELRTLMRYFVFQEGKTILGGRLPRQLMGELQSSSANTHMDAPTLAGALNGAEAQASTIRDNAERARFGGQMRPAGMRAGPAPAQQAPAVQAPIRVREKASGRTGTLPANEFDPTKFDRL